MTGLTDFCHTAISTKYDELGGKASFLAEPTTGEIVTANGTGVYKYYQGGIITCSPTIGTHEVHGAIINRYNEYKGPNGPLGLATTDEVFTPNYEGRVNTFEHGLISYHYASGQTSDVKGVIATKYFALGGLTSFLGVPSSNELDTSKPGGRMNVFYGGTIIASPAGVYEVHGAIINKYNELGGTASYLGFPTSDEMFTPNQDGRVSMFEGGSITYNYASGVATDAINPTAQVITPSFDVLTVPTFREGDVFTATVMNASPGQIATVQVIGDNNTVQHQYPFSTIDSNGNATFALQMPYLLAKGYTVDGRTVRVTVGQ